MAMRITNVSRGLVLVRLRSGTTIHLAAGEQSDEVPDVELQANRRVEALVERSLITLAEAAPRRRSGRATAAKDGPE